MLGSSITIASGNTLTSTAAKDVLDNIILTIGTDGDGAVLLRSAVLNADTALTGVLIGTPDTTALAANSLIISNITADGDILIAVNDGGASKQMIFLDGSTGVTHLGKPGTPAVAVNTGDVYCAGILEVDGSCNFGANISVGSTLNFNTIASLGAARVIRVYGVDDFFIGFNARDNGVGDVEIARMQNAADPYFSFGGSQQFKFTNAGLAGFFAATPVAQQTGYAVPTDLATCISSLTALRTALINYGLTTTV